MSWLRLDDGFASNPKLAGLSDREFRIWIRTLCFCGRYSDPSVDDIAVNEVAGLTWELIARFHEAGLVDHVNGSNEVHDWASYQPRDATGAERQARWRARRAGSPLQLPVD